MLYRGDGHRPASRVPPAAASDQVTLDNELGSSNVIERLTEDHLLDATGGDPMVRAAVQGGRIVGAVWSGYGAHIWQEVHRGEPALAGIGSPVGAARLLEAVLSEIQGLRHASLPRGWLQKIADGRIEYRADWDWFWTNEAPGARSNLPDAAWLELSDLDEVRGLLKDAMPDAATWPGDARVRRWAGIRQGVNHLVACAADTARSPLIGHLSSVATAMDQRRKGYGAVLIDWMIRQYLDEGAEIITLGMYTDNIAGRRFYDRLGFTREHEFTSAGIAPV